MLILNYFITIHLYAQVNTEQQLDSLFAKYSSKDAPGFSLTIVKDGEVIHSYQRGLANLEYDIPINDKTIFMLASISKQFTAACISLLISDKKMALDDDVRKYLPELPNYGKTITIRHLLNQTSGIRNHNVLQDLKGSNYEFEIYTNKQVCELIFQQKGINNVPGEKMLYSNSNYLLLALILERVSGKSLNSFATEHIFQPLGMSNTFYKSSNNEIIKNNAYPYYKDAKGYQQPRNIGIRGLNSTGRDLAKWSTIFTSNHSPFADISKFLTTTDTLNDGTRSTYARGMFVSNYKGYQTVHHSGMDIGMRTQMISIPKENITVILLANTEHINAIDLCYQVLDLFIKPISISGKKVKVYTHKTKELISFTGDYQEINSDLKMSIMMERDTLKAKSSMGAHQIPLVATNKNQFKRISNASVTYTFNTPHTLKYDMVVDFGGANFYFERVQLIDPAKVPVFDYVGEYYSEELGVKYRLFVEDNNLYLCFPFNPKVLLLAGQKDVFGSQNRTRFTFKRNEKNAVSNFTIASEGTVKDIEFKKLN